MFKHQGKSKWKTLGVCLEIYNTTGSGRRKNKTLFSVKWISVFVRYKKMKLVSYRVKKFWGSSQSKSIIINTENMFQCRQNISFDFPPINTCKTLKPLGYVGSKDVVVLKGYLKSCTVFPCTSDYLEFYVGETP